MGMRRGARSGVRDGRCSGVGFDVPTRYRLCTYVQVKYRCLRQESSGLAAAYQLLPHLSLCRVDDGLARGYSSVSFK